MTRRSKVSQAALLIAPGHDGEKGIRIGETQGLVAPIPKKTTTVTLRLSGPWHVLWNRHRNAVPGVSDAELLRPAGEVLQQQKITLEMGDYLELRPHLHNTDGFFAAVLERV